VRSEGGSAAARRRRCPAAGPRGTREDSRTREEVLAYLLLLLQVMFCRTKGFAMVLSLSPLVMGQQIEENGKGRKPQAPREARASAPRAPGLSDSSTGGPAGLGDICTGRHRTARRPAHTTRVRLAPHGPAETDDIQNKNKPDG